MSDSRSHERSPWRIAYESLLASRGSSSETVTLKGSSSETVTLKVNAKGEVQPEVTAVRRDGESLLEAYGRASHVLRIARADHAPSESLLPAEGLTAAPEPYDA